MHPDPEDLALAALGEADERTAAHVAGCARCRAEVAAHARVVDAGRTGALVEPPPGLWQRIADDVGGEAEVAEVVVPMPPPRRRGRMWAAVAVAAATGAVVVLLVQRLLLPTAPEVLAAASLEPLPGWDGGGTAELVEDDDGTRLQVDLDSGAASGYREVWLISDDLERLVSLGVLDGATGTFAIPAGLDVADYPVVDVSDEPFDGDPAHSGESIARGTLD